MIAMSFVQFICNYFMLSESLFVAVVSHFNGYHGSLLGKRS